MEKILSKFFRKKEMMTIMVGMDFAEKKSYVKYSIP